MRRSFILTFILVFAVLAVVSQEEGCLSDMSCANDGYKLAIAGIPVIYKPETLSSAYLREWGGLVAWSNYEMVHVYSYGFPLAFAKRSEGFITAPMEINYANMIIDVAFAAILAEVITIGFNRFRRKAKPHTVLVS